MIHRPQPDLSDIWEDGPPVPKGAVPGPARRLKAGKRRPGPRAPRRLWLTVLGYGALTLACLGAAGAAFLIVATPVDLARDRFIEHVRARTGRDLAVAGPTALSLFPRPTVSLSDVSVSASGDADGPPILTTPKVEAELSLWSLLTAQPAIERVTLHRPSIELVVDPNGRRSWEAASARPRRTEAGPGAAADTSAEAPSTQPAPAAETRSLSARPKSGFGTIRILDATVHYRDETSGSRTDIEALNLTLAAGDPSGPLNIDGSLTVRGTPLTIAATVSSGQALLADQPTPLSIAVSGPPFQGTYQGTLSLAGGFALDGALKVQAASARALSDWVRLPDPGNVGSPDAMSITAELKASPTHVALSKLQASFGATTMAGSLTVATEQKRRVLTGNLEVSELDFGRLLTKPARTRAAPDAHPPSSRGSPPPVAAAPPAATALQPAERQGRGRNWSEDPINLPILDALDVNISLSAASLIHNAIRTGPSRLSVVLENGNGRFNLENVELYGGRARGLVTLERSGDLLVANTKLILNRVALHPFLADSLQFPWLEGTANMYLELAGQGITERQIVESLNGKVEISGTEGALIGLDVGKAMRGLARGRLPSLTPSPEEKTSFSALSATFIVTNGVAKNEDLKLVSSHLQLAGEGTVELGPRQIDYTMRTKISADQSDPGATLKIGTIEVPISIAGPWERPAFGIKGQEQLTGTVKQIGKNLRSQEVRDAIKGLLQGDGEKRVKPRDLIDKLLKKD